MMVAVEPDVPDPEPPPPPGDPLFPWEPPPALPLPPMPLLLLGVVPSCWHPLEELVEMGVLALLDADPGALLAVAAEVEPVPEPAEVTEFGGAEAAAVAAATAEGTPVVDASGRHVST